MEAGICISYKAKDFSCIKKCIYLFPTDLK